MKIIYVVSAPQCNFCDQRAVYDAPTSNFGQWAFMCESCSKIHSSSNKLNIGTKFEIRKIKKASNPNKKLIGIEPDGDDYVEAVNSEGYRTIQCPICGGQRHLEIDAEGEFRCDFCSQIVLIPQFII